MDDYKVILDYARKNYRNMFREMEGNLKYRFIVPGSCYSNCLWDWDSWLTDIALRQFVTEDIREYEVGCVLNYLERCDARGRIPIVILPDGFMPDLHRRGKGQNLLRRLLLGLGLGIASQHLIGGRH